MRRSPASLDDAAGSRYMLLDAIRRERGKTGCLASRLRAASLYWGSGALLWTELEDMRSTGKERTQDPPLQ